MRSRKDGEETRHKILLAAAEVFSEKGFRDSTNAEICQRCGANSALINYHFQDKESLYRLAWKFALNQTLQRYPFDGNVPIDASPEKKLWGRISALVRQNADPACYDMQIWRKELANPTGLLDELRQQMVIPLRREMGKVIRLILGPEASNDQVKLCTMSIISQCRAPIFNQNEMRQAFLDVDIETRIAHIFRFSLGGLVALRNSFQ